MQPLQVLENTNFIGRSFERAKLADISEWNESAIIVVYGRRRVGKTELIEQTYRDRNIIKIEGLEGGDADRQREHALAQISRYTNDPLYSKVQVTHWVEVFDILAKLTATGVWTLYFEELQWLANYQDDFISEFKYVWDNFFRRNPQLRVVLCGSSPSFMINKVMHSKALYNRSQYEISLKPLRLNEAKIIFAKQSEREIMDAYLTVGGIPEYLKRLHQKSSVFLGLCAESFSTDSYFSKEYKRIFISSFAQSVHYKEVIEFLSKRRFATRNEIAHHLKIKPGGTLTALLDDLTLCGFIDCYRSFHLPKSNHLVRYAIADNYLMFYFKFIKPIEHEIEQGKFNARPEGAINQDSYYKWLGFAFERFCRQNSTLIAKILGFSAVKYTSGAYFEDAAKIKRLVIKWI